MDCIKTSDLSYSPSSIIRTCGGRLSVCDSARSKKKEDRGDSMALGENQSIPDRRGSASAPPMPLPIVDANPTTGMIKEIARRRSQVVVPLFLSSFAIYIATLIALSYFPRLVGYRVFGAINLAYVLALAQFVVTFLTAFIYALWSRLAIDPLVAATFAILSR